MNARILFEELFGSPSSLYRKPNNPEEEHIVAAAVRSSGASDDVFLGDDHTHAFDVAEKYGVVIPAMSASTGFWTSKGRYVGRDEAMAIVRAQKQRARPHQFGGAELDAWDMVELEQAKKLARRERP